ncbi:TIGR02611 family protein [Microbacterium chocolatum]|uniref:TIGR02611 family protein n=1 Tax=Microbacterium aurantiacum TaxID=162393 RepID=UPI00338DB581
MSASSAPFDAPFEREIRDDIAHAERSGNVWTRSMRRGRAFIARHPLLQVAYRIAIGVVGTVVSVLGLILVPLPGPGWLVVFLGLAILGTEFHWARRISLWGKRMLERFWTWWRARRAARQARSTG